MFGHSGHGIRIARLPEAIECSVVRRAAAESKVRVSARPFGAADARVVYCS